MRISKKNVLWWLFSHSQYRPEYIQGTRNRSSRHVQIPQHQDCYQRYGAGHKVRSVSSKYSRLTWFLITFRWPDDIFLNGRRELKNVTDTFAEFPTTESGALVPPPPPHPTLHGYLPLSQVCFHAYQNYDSALGQLLYGILRPLT